MKNLFCKRLAACLCKKRLIYPSPEPPVISRKVGSAHISNSDNGFQQSNLTASSTEITENEETTKLLEIMCHLLETLVHKVEQQRHEDDKENEMKNDWMLAAAVLDRICAIAVTVFFVVGTVVFFIVFAKRP